jgi:hypothetical protein
MIRMGGRLFHVQIDFAMFSDRLGHRRSGVLERQEALSESVAILAVEL